MIQKNNNSKPIPSVDHFLKLLLCCVFLFAAGYLLSSTCFPSSVYSNNFLGVGMNRYTTFNITLFYYLMVGFIVLTLLHMVGICFKTQISNGNKILAVLLILSTTSFIIGINLPVLRTQKLWVFNEKLSLLEVLANLKLKGEFQLYFIMLIFTFIIPSFKLVCLGYQIFVCKNNTKGMQVLSFLNKWAMLDVVIISILVATINHGGGFVEMHTDTGLSFFIASVLLSMIISVALRYTRNICKI
jgi:paraquat-inducible protein A